MMKRALMARTGARAPKLSSEPNVIPFIDVLLVLLIIFMVTAPKPTVDLHVDLPHGIPAPSPRNPTVVVLRDEGGALSLFVDGQSASMTSLGELTLARLRANNPDVANADLLAQGRVFVRADQNTAYGNVIDVMNVLREAHFARVGIFAEQAQDG